MKLTPAQLGMRLIATGTAPMHSYATKAEGVAYGRFRLTRQTREDFGYDLKSWHDYLAGNKRYAPFSRDKPGNYPSMILRALEDPDWINAVRSAEENNLFESIQTEHRTMRDAALRAERRWAGQQRRCPKCRTAFVSVQDRGQCPECGHIFYASNPEKNPDWWRENAT